MTPNQVQATSDRAQEGGGGEIRNMIASRVRSRQEAPRRHFSIKLILKQTFAVNDLGRAVAFTSGSRELFISI